MCGVRLAGMTSKCHAIQLTRLPLCVCFVRQDCPATAERSASCQGHEGCGLEWLSTDNVQSRSRYGRGIASPRFRIVMHRWPTPLPSGDFVPRETRPRHSPSARRTRSQHAWVSTDSLPIPSVLSRCRPNRIRGQTRFVRWHHAVVLARSLFVGPPRPRLARCAPSSSGCVMNPAPSSQIMARRPN